MSSTGRIASVLLAAVLLAGCNAKSDPEPGKGDPKASPKDVPKDPLAEAKELLAAGTAVMIDVRSQGERDGGHLDGSIFLPITQIKEASGKKGFSEWTAGKIPKGKIVYLH